MREEVKESDFKHMMRENHDTIRRIAGYYVNDPHEQKDLYQEIVSQLWLSFDDFRGDASPGTWLYRVALNTAISHLRKKKSRPNWKF